MATYTHFRYRPNATVTARPDIIEPERVVLIFLLDLDRKRRLTGSVDGVAKARVKSIEGGVDVVSGDTGFCEGGLDGRMRAIRNCRENR